MSEKISITLPSLPDTEYFESGHTACAGCGPAIAVKQAMKILGDKNIVYAPACCLLVFGATYPINAWRVPFIHCAFENSAAVAAGVAAALKYKKIEDVNAVVFAGDGGTVDIGVQAISGAAERGDNVLYICYDNEAYGNTGMQRSGATPFGAWTTTTPVGSLIKGKTEHKKDFPRIMMAHDVPYVATATIAYWRDYMQKVARAKEIKGFRYLHVLAPCPTGWRYPTADTVKVSELAVETGIWILYEYDHGKFRFTGPSKLIADGMKERKPIKEYLMMQGRFRHLTEKEIEEIQKYVDSLWDEYKKWTKNS
jgi:pyruvate ferredoxin oxidoreductase beta subunit